MEYLRRVVHGLDHEPESLLDELPSVEAVLDYFDLFCTTYGTDFWEGVLECIAEGDDPKPALAFIEKYGLQDGWRASVEQSVAFAKEARHA